MALILIFISFNGIAAAEIVTVNGYGKNESDAIDDAKRNAVEQVVGIVLKSRSKMQNFKLVMDVIDTRTQGYINSFKILSKEKDGSYISINARVDVSNEPNSSLMKDVEMVMMLNDPKMSVEIDYYGDDGTETLKKYPVITATAIHEELIKSGFTHVMDSTNDVDYTIIGRLTVNKAKAIKLPKWSSISDDEVKMLDTNLSKTTATLDCKIKKVATDEIIGEFHVSGDGMSSSDNDIQMQAVEKMASQAAQEVKKLLSREASKAFYSINKDLSSK